MHHRPLAPHVNSILLKMDIAFKNAQLLIAHLFAHVYVGMKQFQSFILGKQEPNSQYQQKKGNRESISFQFQRFRTFATGIDYFVIDQIRAGSKAVSIKCVILFGG